MLLARILIFFGTHTDSTIFRYSPRQVVDSRTDSTICRCSFGFYHFSVLTLIRRFSDIRRHKLSILARILPFPGTRPDSTIFPYSHCIDPFPVLVGRIFQYLHGFYLFPVLIRILPFFGTHTHSTLFQYSPGHFFDTRTDSTFSRYSPRFYHFWVLTLIRPFSYTCPDTFSILARILPFAGTLPDFTICRYSH